MPALFHAGFARCRPRLSLLGIGSPLSASASSSSPYSVSKACASKPCSRSQRTITATLPCVTITRSAPVCRWRDAGPASRHGRRARSRGRPRAAGARRAAASSRWRRRRRVAEAAHPGVPAADGGASTSARKAPPLSIASSVTRSVAAARRRRRGTRLQRLDRAVADDRADRRIDAGRMRCALPKRSSNRIDARPCAALPRHQALMSANISACCGQR